MYRKKIVKFGYVVFEICEQRDRHTDTLIAILRTHIGINIADGSLIGLSTEFI